MARPPGKRNSSIHQLSGGEKALTAVALVFSIFDLNPAPFCLLDEVDAPLDEHNVGRFCDIVKQMSERVQFIFITHNKATMELASQLLGVTMHEPGCSRLVSVDVDEAVRMATALRSRMPELRIILLMAGVLFIAGIAGFEWWRARRGRALRRDRARGCCRRRCAPSASKEPLPDINVVREPRMAVGGHPAGHRAREHLGIRHAPRTRHRHFRRSRSGCRARQRVAAKHERRRARTSRTSARTTRSREVRVFDEQPVRGPQLALAWPNEAERRIVTLRVVPHSANRVFRAARCARHSAAPASGMGRSTSITCPTSSGRVIVSAAALAQPGTFDPSIMDSQRFSGPEPVRGAAGPAARARSLR